MNRATKRLLAKQEAAAERERARQAPITKGQQASRRMGGAPGPGPQPAQKQREKWIKRATRFLREVRQELKKVAWPSRTEVFTYTVVVLVSVTAVTLYTFFLDLGFGKAVLHLFKG